MVNVTKSTTPPASLATEALKVSGSCRGEDVVRLIRNDFNGKCYLCEDKNLTNINVEHFKPHRSNVALKFEWSNLFYCCGHCNNTKLADPRFNDILDCTNPAHDVLSSIKLKIDPFPFEKVLVEPLIDDMITGNTATLLREIYNGTTPLKQLESESLRHKIILEIQEFQSLLTSYFRDTNTQDQQDILRDGIRRKLSIKNQFTAFKVWIIKSNPKLLIEFEEYIPVNT